MMCNPGSARERAVRAGLAFLLAGVSGTMGLLAMVTWLVGAWQWLTLQTGQVPMSPFTAAFLFLLNAAFWVQWQRGPDPLVRRLAAGTVWVIGAGGLLALLRPFMPELASLESWQASAEPYLMGVPVTYMSPLTGALFMVLAGVYGLQGRSVRACRVLAGVLALAVAAFSAWVVGSYAAGAPLLAGTIAIPMALLTAQAFLLTGLAAAWVSLRGIGSTRQAPGPEPDDRPWPDRSWLFLFALAVAAIITGGLVQRAMEQGRILAAYHRGFAQMSKLVEGQVLRWRADRLADARRLAGSPLFRRLAADWLADPGKVENRNLIRERLVREQSMGVHGRLLLAAVRGEPRISVPPDARMPGRETLRVSARALDSPDPVLGDLYRDEAGEVWVDVAAALRDDEGRPQAILVLSTDTSHHLKPLLAAGIMGDGRIETVLVGGGGAWVLDAGGMRRHQASPLYRPWPAAEPMSGPVAYSFTGEGQYYGEDDRGAMVLADVRAIPGTDWRLVVKGRAGVILAEARRRTDVVLVVAVLLILGAAGGTGYVHQKRLLAERERAGGALKESQALYQDLVSSQAAGVYRIRVNRQGAWSSPDEPPYRYEFVNDRYCELTGVSRERHLADPSITLKQIHPDDAAGWAACNEQANQKLETFLWEGRLQVRGGVMWAHYESRPRLRPDGSVVWTGVLVDITDRKRAEDELRRARDAAEAANRAKSFFLANMSHEIRTPMNAIMGFTDQVLRGDLNPRQRGFLEIVYARCEDLLRLINDILDLSRIEAGRLELEPVCFSPASALEEAAQVFAFAAAQKGLSMVTAVSDQVPKMVLGDARRVRQVLVNLAGNAVKFTDRGEVRLAVDRSDPRDPSPGAVTLRFEVRDTGVGIPPDQQALIFEPFVQGSHTTSRFAGGTGLGLTIAKRLLEMMHGRLWVESAAGTGTAFFFTARFQLPPAGQPRGGA